MLGSHSPTVTALTNASPSSPLYFSYVVNIWMENKNCAGFLTSSNAPYEYSLATQYAYDNCQFSDIASPSAPDYIGFLGGSYPSCATSDADPSSCSAGAQTNLVDRLEAAGLSWNAYLENYPAVSGCSGMSGTGSYYARHEPFLYFTDITGNSARCAKILNSGGSAGSSSDSAFLSTLNQASGWPNYIWLTPNGCNDMHDCGTSSGDTWLSTLIPKILSSTLFTTQKAAIILNWDEYAPAPGPIFAGSAVKTSYVSTASYNTYSLTSTLLNNWGLSCLVNDCGKTPMSEFFGTTSIIPDFGLTASPTSVSFTAGSSGSSTITMIPANGFTGTVTLSPSSLSGITTTCSPSSLSGTVLTSSCAFSASQATSGTITVTGTSGGLAHSISIGVSATSSGGSGGFVASQWSLTAPSPSSATISNGVLTETVVDTASSYSGSFYSTAQYLRENGFSGPSIPVSSFSSHVNIGTINTISSGYLYHVYMGLYFTLPSTVTAGGMTSSWIDGQVQVEYCSSSTGCYPAGYTYNSYFGDRFGYREILTTQGANTGYDFVNFDVQAYCARAEAALGIPSAPCTLVRVEPGIEGYGVNPFTVGWTTFTVNGASSGNCTNGATNPPTCNICLPGQSIVTGICTIQSPVSLLTIPGSVTATPGSRVVFVANSTNLNLGQTIVVTVAGLPHGASFDQSTRQFSWSPTTADIGSHNMTFTATDNSSPPKTTAKSMMINVQQASRPPSSQPAQGPGICFQCIFTPSMLTSLWLLVVSALVGLMAVMGTFYKRARSNLAVVRRSKHPRQSKS